MSGQVERSARDDQSNQAETCLDEIDQLLHLRIAKHNGTLLNGPKENSTLLMGLASSKRLTIQSSIRSSSLERSLNTNVNRFVEGHSARICTVEKAILTCFQMLDQAMC